MLRETELDIAETEVDSAFTPATPPESVAFVNEDNKKVMVTSPRTRGTSENRKASLPISGFLLLSVVLNLWAFCVCSIEGHHHVFKLNPAVPSACRLSEIGSQPQFGSKYLIRHITTKEVITLSHGLVILSSKTNNATQVWTYQAATHDGWNGFREDHSGKYLGRNQHWQLAGFAGHCHAWEHIQVNKVPGLGHRLIFRDEHWLREIRRPVTIQEVGGVKNLVIGEFGKCDEAMWEFVKAE